MLTVLAMPEPVIRELRGFISYAHEDYAVMSEYDQETKAGSHWDEAIENEIARAEVFVLLATPAFLATAFINKFEIPSIKRRLSVCKGKVIPVLVRACAWEYELGAMQAVPTRAKRPPGRHQN